MSAQPSSTFTIYPAIDIRGGRVVRLRQGDFDREDVFSTDPASVARTFAETGASWIHVVDLDGALLGGRRQAEAVAAIVASLASGEALPPGGPPPSGDRSAEPLGPNHRPRLQVGGGIRDHEAIDAVLALRAERVVIGTAALADPAFAGAAVDRHGADRIGVAIDVRNGLAIGQGWVAGARGVPVGVALERLSAVGVTTFAVTAIDRDGLLGGPDLALLERAIDATDAAIIASGGIASLDDIRAVRQIGCAGAIVGRALYDGTLDLGTVLAAAAALPDVPGENRSADTAG
ncbi:MAG: 1-(5-phosphoribosyl)-5-[(5-phosphoribosylamino)methylideneamino] imidazole-4-carboxamide isomerase [Chloroflexota bacterium]|nr:1-(5-phosphoribosyl)-5-[(5-phosphoribosylamino)methylideneamino] imidazole-4-carboxamide isomerase [Chloroflexota bacterium]